MSRALQPSRPGLALHARHLVAIDALQLLRYEEAELLGVEAEDLAQQGLCGGGWQAERMSVCVCAIPIRKQKSIETHTRIFRVGTLHGIEKPRSEA